MEEDFDENLEDQMEDPGDDEVPFGYNVDEEEPQEEFDGTASQGANQSTDKKALEEESLKEDRAERYLQKNPAENGQNQLNQRDPNQGATGTAQETGTVNVEDMPGGPALKAKGRGSTAGKGKGATGAAGEAVAEAGEGAAESAGKSVAGSAISKAEAVKDVALIGKDIISGDFQAAEDTVIDAGSEALGTAARAYAISSGIGAFVSGLVDQATSWLSKKILPLIIKAQKLLFKYYALILTFFFIGLFLIIGQGIGIASSFGSGILGKTEEQSAAAYNGEDLAGINTVLGAEIIGNASQWLYKQGDERWGMSSYGCNTTIKRAGCGCTSAAMVLRKYGAQVTPKEICDYSRANGHRICNAGTSTSLFKPVAEKFGLKMSVVDWETGKQLLAQGKPLIKNFGGLPFSSGGHYVVLVGIQGKTVYVNDPGPRNTKTVTEWDVLNKKRSGGFYYIHP